MKLMGYLEFYTLKCSKVPLLLKVVAALETNSITNHLSENYSIMSFSRRDAASGRCERHLHPLRLPSRTVVLAARTVVQCGARRISIAAKITLENEIPFGPYSGRASSLCSSPVPAHTYPAGRHGRCRQNDIEVMSFRIDTK
jgi:hypothetical protein